MSYIFHQDSSLTELLEKIKQEQANKGNESYSPTYDMLDFGECYWKSPKAWNIKKNILDYAAFNVDV